MKKRLYLILCLVSILILSGCTNQKQNTVAAEENIEWQELEYLDAYEQLDEKYYEVFRGIELEGLEKAIKEEKTCLIMLSFPSCHNCQEVINEIGKTAYELNKKIYILDPSKLVESKETYNKALEILNDVLLENDEGEKKLYTPEIIRIDKGKFADHFVGNGVDELTAIIKG